MSQAPPTTEVDEPTPPRWLWAVLAAWVAIWLLTLGFRGLYDPDEGRLIVLPTYRGKQGNPMLWDREFFPEIMDVSGDSGARFLVGQHIEAVAEVEMAEDAVLRDFDTTESLSTLPQRLRPEGVG